MHALESIVGIVGIMRTKVIEEQKSYATVSEELKRSYPTVTRGLSARSVRHFCKAHNIQAYSRLSDMQLDRVVRSSVARVKYSVCFLIYDPSLPCFRLIQRMEEG